MRGSTAILGCRSTFPRTAIVCSTGGLAARTRGVSRSRAALAGETTSGDPSRRDRLPNDSSPSAPGATGRAWPPYGLLRVAGEAVASFDARSRSSCHAKRAENADIDGAGGSHAALRRAVTKLGSSPGSFASTWQ